MKRLKFFPIMMAMILMLTLPAYAFSPPELSLNFHYYPEIYTAQFINEMSTTTELGYLDEMAVVMYVTNVETENVVCNTWNSSKNPTRSWLNVSWSGVNELPTGLYRDVGVAQLIYIPQFDWATTNREKEQIFNHDGRSKASEVGTISNESRFLERGIEIASKFQSIPSDYSIHTEREMVDFLGIDAYYFSIQPQMYLCFGDTVPVFFLSPNEDEFFAVKRDDEGNSYSFSFKKSDSGEWELSDDALMCQQKVDTSEPNIQLENDVDCISVKVIDIPEDYVLIDKHNIHNYMQSVQEFLSVRHQHDGGTVLYYYLSPNQDRLIVIKSNQAGDLHHYIFVKSNDKTWTLM